MTWRITRRETAGGRWCIIFWMPWLGLAIGALSGAVVGHFTDIGIDDKLIKEVGETIEPGQSALFLLVYQWTEDID